MTDPKRVTGNQEADMEKEDSYYYAIAAELDDVFAREIREMNEGKEMNFSSYMKKFRRN